MFKKTVGAASGFWSSERLSFTFILLWLIINSIIPAIINAKIRR